MTWDQFSMYLKAAQRTRRDDQMRMLTAMRIAVGADEKQLKQIMKELES